MYVWAAPQLVGAGLTLLESSACALVCMLCVGVSVLVRVQDSSRIFMCVLMHEWSNSDVRTYCLVIQRGACGVCGSGEGRGVEMEVRRAIIFSLESPVLEP